MISRIRGTLLHRGMTAVEVMTSGGVGYELLIPLSVYERLPREGSEVELRVVQVVRADSVELFGFLEDRERLVFSRVLTVSGIGTRLALNIVAAMTPDRLVQAITERDTATLRRIPGMGAKKAERLVLELVDKMDDLAGGVTVGPGPTGRVAEAAVGALIALGYSAGQAASAVRRALDEQPSLEGTALIKAALARVGG